MKNKNKKAMLGNLIGAFIVIAIGFSLIPMISQELNNAMSCNQTNSTTNISYQEPIGSTNSFGGGGGQFGGYDGTVHKAWGSDFAIYKTNKTITGLCLNENSPWATTILKLVPGFFVLAIIFVAIGTIYSSFRNSGLM